MGGGQHLEVVVQLALGQAFELMAMKVLRMTDHPQRAARALAERHCRTQRPRPCMIMGARVRLGAARTGKSWSSRRSLTRYPRSHRLCNTYVPRTSSRERQHCAHWLGHTSTMSGAGVTESAPVAHKLVRDDCDHEIVAALRI